MKTTKAKMLVAGAMAVVCLAAATLVIHHVRAAHRHWSINQLADSGYRTPEAALKTLLWGIRIGDGDALLASLSPGEKARAQAAWRGKFDQVMQAFKSGLEQTAELRIISEATSPDGITIDLLATRVNGRKSERKFSFKKIRSEWKCDQVYPYPKIEDDKQAGR